MYITKIVSYIGFLILLMLIPLVMKAQQTITGNFPSLAYQQVKLVGFEGFTTYAIDSVKVSEKGTFQLSFNTKDYGMGYLAAEDNKAFIVILAAEDISLEGELLALPETVKIRSGKQNQLFAQYAAELPHREQALIAWDYLENSSHKIELIYILHHTKV